MRKTLQLIFLLLVFLSIVVLILRFGIKPIQNALGLKEHTGIKIESVPEAQVSIDGNNIGKTPFESDKLDVGNHLVELRINPSDSPLWRGNVPLNPGTVTVVNRELEPTVATSSGEIIALEKGSGVIVISSPDQADLTIDNKSYGQTPVKIDDLPPGEHVFIIGRNNYLKRSIKAAVVEGYRLSLTVDLALSEADLTKVNTPVMQASQEVQIKATPTGFLRVRKTASTNAPEVGRLTPGDKVTLLEEAGDWYRVRLPNGTEGYISATYALKLTQ